MFHSVSKNGKLLSQGYEQERENSKPGLKPHSQKLTKIDIPELGIHQKYFEDDELESARKNHVKRNVSVGDWYGGIYSILLHAGRSGRGGEDAQC